MSLLNLPTEAIRLIAKLTIPEDFENFALICKFVYNASSIFRPEYNKLQRRYKHFSYQVNGTEVDLQLLLDIAENPVVARYIVNADLRDIDSALPRGLENVPLKRAMDPKEAGGNLLNLLSRSRYLRELQQDPKHWMELILGGSTNYTVAFLLTLMPNLKELTLPRRWNPVLGRSTNEELLAFVNTVVRDANDPLRTDAALSKLNKMNCTKVAGYGSDLWYGANSIIFLAIDAMREFCCGAAKMYMERPPEIDLCTKMYPPSGLKLESLEMSACSATAEDVLLLLSHMPLLKIFRFSYEMKYLANGVFWNPKDFVSAIEDTVGGTLEELSISMFEEGCMLMDGPPIVSMKRLKSMRTLEIDTRVLLSERYRMDLDTDFCYMSNDNPVISIKEPGLPTLIGLLPRSVESLRLLTNNDDRCVACVLNLCTDFDRSRNAELPNLSSIDIHCYYLGEAKPTTLCNGPNLVIGDPPWLEKFSKALGPVKVNFIWVFENPSIPPGFLDMRQHVENPRGHAWASFMTDLVLKNR
jgi:hypothetical protein